MGLEDIERALKNYYGEHQSEFVQKTAMKYIEGTYSPETYKTLLQEIMKTHSFNFGFPDVAAIEKAGEYYFKSKGKTLKPPKQSGSEWINKIPDLTEEEREQAEPMREGWEGLLKDICGVKLEKKQKKYCKECTYFMTEKSNYHCKGCIDHNKYESKDEA